MTESVAMRSAGRNSPARSDGKVEVGRNISGKMSQINPQLLEFR